MSGAKFGNIPLKYLCNELYKGSTTLLRLILLKEKETLVIQCKGGRSIYQISFTH